MKREIRSKILKAIKKLNIDSGFEVEKPSNESFGDFSTNAALIAAKKTNQSPLKLAESIVNLLKKEEIKNIKKIEIAGSGFINFWLSEDFFISRLDELLKNGSLPTQFLNNKKVMVEFTDPNPFKEFHVGHLYSNIVGECIARLLNVSDAQVQRVNYQGDIGLHVAKAIWGIKKLGEVNLKKGSLEEKAKFLGLAYSLGAKTYEEDEEIKKQINLINKKLYENDKEFEEIYSEGRKISLEYFEKIYKRLGTKFDRYYFESEVGKIGLELVKQNTENGIFKKSEGAIIFDGEKMDLHNRVFVNSLGLPTYEAKELALAGCKYEDFKYDESIVITGNEISEYFRVVMAALEKINPELAKKTKHLTHGMVRLPQGKMSSRFGNVVSYEWLLTEIKERLRNSFKDMEEDVLEKVTISAVKYAFLRTRLGKDIEFDFDKSISLEGDSGPYLQYAYTRTQSILSKAKKRHKNTKTELNDEELSLLRSLYSFEEIIQKAATLYLPNTICEYLFDLAKKFNLFYQKHRIIESENEEFRLKLTKAVGNTIKTGLNILGIESSNKM